jgi:small conductance mechanosensitive channel
METVIESVRNFVEAHGPAGLKALVILVVGWLVAKFLKGLVRRLMVRSGVDPTLIGFCASITYMVLMVLVVVSALGKLGVQTTSFIAVIAAAGLAVGFALQGSLGNFAAGVLLIAFRPFKVGDFIEAGGTSGAVEEIQVFATTLKTPDNKAITVPNAAITGGNIINYSAKPVRRVDMVFGIGYGDDIKRAKEVIQGILTKDSRILKEPEPTIAVSELADSSVNIAVRPWVKTADYWGVFFDTTEAVKLEFDAQGITIPYPQQDVHMHQAA